MTLDEYAESIRAIYHYPAETMGRMLIEAKKQLKHGEYMPWLHSLGMNQRSANDYMRAADRKEKQPPRSWGLVYFLRANGLVKIGRTRRLAKRLRALEQEVGKVEVLDLIEAENAPGLEAELHLMFKDARRHGEWFDLTDDQIAKAKAYADHRTTGSENPGTPPVAQPQADA